MEYFEMKIQEASCALCILRVLRDLVNHSKLSFIPSFISTVLKFKINLCLMFRNLK